LDHVAFEECHQTANETFDDFVIRLKRLAGTAELCAHCSDERLATRVMAGVRDGESRRKLLSLPPFPTLQQAVNLCRGEESVRANERTLSGQSFVNALNARPRRQPLPPGTAICKACGRLAHNKEEICPAIGRQCHICNEPGHFSPRCPKRPQSESASREKSVRFKAKVPHIAVCNLQVTNRRRKTPTINLDLRAGSARAFTAVTSAIPDLGAEVFVGLDVLNSLGLAEADLSGAKYDLVQADRSSTLLSVGQLELTVHYGPREAQCTVVFCPAIRGMLLSCVDCISLGILHPTYPKPLPAGDQSSIRSVGQSTPPSDPISFLALFRP
jgi:hypothetical protein